MCEIVQVFKSTRKGILPPEALRRVSSQQAVLLSSSGSDYESNVGLR
jgi:hypothetical protein